MIPEIGIMIGLFILVRLIPEKWRVPRAVGSGLAALAALVAVLDLASRGFLDQGLLEKRPPEEVAKVKREKEISARPPHAAVSKTDGGAITTILGYGIALDKDSSLHREFIAVHDLDLPVQLAGTPGLGVTFSAKAYGGEYRYSSQFTLTTSADLRAIDVRFLAFDVWGEYVGAFNYTKVMDIPAKASPQFKGEWSLLSEPVAEKHYASIAYVSRVRLADGRVLKADERPVLEEAKRFNARFTAEQLALEPVGKPPSQPPPKRT